MVLSSTITSKITPQIVGFVLDNVLKVSKDYRSIPFEVYERFVQESCSLATLYYEMKGGESTLL